MREEFPESSFVKAKLMQKPLYREEAEPWDVLTRHADDISHFFRQIGQELVFNHEDGYAFIRQMRGEADEKIPKIVQRRALGYEVTMLLVCLREEYLRMEISATDSNRIVKTRDEITALVSTYLPETTNQVKDLARVHQAIQRLEDLGFLEKREEGERESYELMRIIKARVTPDELKQIKERLTTYAKSNS